MAVAPTKRAAALLRARALRRDCCANAWAHAPRAALPDRSRAAECRVSNARGTHDRAFIGTVAARSYGARDQQGPTRTARPSRRVARAGRVCRRGADQLCGDAQRHSAEPAVHCSRMWAAGAALASALRAQALRRLAQRAPAQKLAAVPTPALSDVWGVRFLAAGGGPAATPPPCGVGPGAAFRGAGWCGFAGSGLGAAARGLAGQAGGEEASPLPRKKRT